MSTALDEPDQLEPTPPRPAGRRRRRGGRNLRNRPALAAAVGLLAVGLGFAAWSVPPVHTVLVESFTEKSDSFTELYFTSDPAFDGSTLVVPMTLNAHGTGVSLYHIRVTVESPDGKALTTSTVDLTPRDGTPVPVVARLQTNAGNASLVRVALVGHPQSLHFLLGKQSPNT